MTDLLFGPRPASVRRVAALTWGLPPESATVGAMHADDPETDTSTPTVEARALFSGLGGA